jgi:hypothetical protein
MNRLMSLWITALIALFATGIAGGADTAVNLTLPQDQERQGVAQLANGTLAFVFEDETAANGRILLRRFDSALIPLGIEQRLNANTNTECREPVVAALAGGGFVVAWSSGGPAGDPWNVAMRRFDAAANPLDLTDVTVNTVTAGTQFRPQVAPLADGGFVVCWVGSTGGVGQEIFYRRFSAAGAALDAADILANGLGVDPVIAGDQGSPGISSLQDGGFVIVYEDRNSDEVFGVRIGADGAALDAPGEAPGHKQFLVNATSPFPQTSPAVAGLAGSGFVVAYNTETSGTAASRRVVGRIFNSSGVGGPEFLVGSHPDRWQDSRVAALPNGDFAVAWQALVTTSVPPLVRSWNVFQQSFSPAGVPRGPASQVNAFETGHQDTPVVVGLSNSGYVVAWESFGQDGSGYGVFARGYSPATLVPGRLTILRAAGGALAKITFEGQPGRDHQLEHAATLGQWAPVLTTNPPDGAFSYFEPVTNAARHFRVLTR